MQVVLLRVGIDSACGGTQGPLFSDGGFEYIPIPDQFRGSGVDKRTYGNTMGRRRRLLDYFPVSRQDNLADKSIHFDPEFETFTYGDPSALKSGLRHLTPGDFLVFYAGLKPDRARAEAALYIIGYFIVAKAGRASDFSKSELRRDFGRNFHVMHRGVFRDQKKRLVLVKGGQGSRLLNRAFRISSVGKDRAGRSIKVLSRRMRRVFGDFGGHVAIQRSPPRWISEEYVPDSLRFLKRLR